MQVFADILAPLALAIGGGGRRRPVPARRGTVVEAPVLVVLDEPAIPLPGRTREAHRRNLWLGRAIGNRRNDLRVEAHRANEVAETRMWSKGLKHGVDIERGQPRLTFLARPLEPSEGCLVVTKADVRERHVKRREVRSGCQEAFKNGHRVRGPANAGVAVGEMRLLAR